MSSLNRQYLPVLTGLRALMAWDVFLFHFADAPRAPKWWIAFTEGGGEMGVSLFFVLSGFLLAHRYAGQISLSGSWFRQYAFRRFARIYPLFLIISLISYGLLVCFSKDFVPDAQSNFLYFSLLKGFSPKHIFYFIPTTWSLTIEEVFYLLVPFMLLALPRIRLAAQGGILMGIGLLTALLYVPGAFPGYSPALSFVLYWTFWGRAFQFICGMALARYLASRPAIARPGGLLAGCTALLVAVCQVAYQPLHQVSIFGSKDLLAILYNDLVVPVAIAVFFYAVMQERSLLTRLMNGRLFQLLGRSSFAFYLLHLSPIVMLAYRRFHPPFLIVFGFVQLLSILFYQCVEHPVHRLLIRKFGARPAKTKAAARS